MLPIRSKERGPGRFVMRQTGMARPSRHGVVMVVTVVTAQRPFPSNVWAGGKVKSATKARHQRHGRHTEPNGVVIRASGTSFKVCGRARPVVCSAWKASRKSPILEGVAGVSNLEPNGVSNVIVNPAGQRSPVASSVCGLLRAVRR